MTSGDLTLEQAQAIQDAHAEVRRRRLLSEVCGVDYPEIGSLDGMTVPAATALEAIKRAERKAAQDGIKLARDAYALGIEDILDDEAASRLSAPGMDCFYVFNGCAYPQACKEAGHCVAKESRAQVREGDGREVPDSATITGSTADALDQSEARIPGTARNAGAAVESGPSLSPPTAEKGARETPCDCAIEHTGCREVSKPGVYCKHDHGGEFIDTPSPVSPQGEEGGGWFCAARSSFNGVWNVWLPDGHYVSGKRVQSPKESQP